MGGTDAPVDAAATAWLLACAALVLLMTLASRVGGLAPVHLGGAIAGCLCVGHFASTSVNEAGGDGLFYNGRHPLLGVQAGGAAIVAAYAFVTTLLIAVVVNRTIGRRVRRRQKNLGLDLAHTARPRTTWPRSRTG